MHYQVSFRTKAWYISSYVRNLTRYLRTWNAYRWYGYVINDTQNKQFSEMVYYSIGVNLLRRTLQKKAFLTNEISLLVLKNISLVRWVYEN